MPYDRVHPKEELARRARDEGDREALGYLLAQQRNVGQTFFVREGFVKFEELDDLIQDLELVTLERIKHLSDPRKFDQFYRFCAIDVGYRALRNWNKRSRVVDSTRVDDLGEVFPYPIRCMDWAGTPEAIVINADGLRRLVRFLGTEFTPSEKRILNLLGAGYSRNEVAERLGITSNTVRIHLSNMRAKIRTKLSNHK